MKRCLGMHIHGLDDLYYKLTVDFLVSYINTLDPRNFFCAHVDSFDESDDMNCGSNTLLFVVGEDDYDD